MEFPGMYSITILKREKREVDHRKDGKISSPKGLNLVATTDDDFPVCSRKMSISFTSATLL
jgi:hypothetical protein